MKNIITLKLVAAFLLLSGLSLNGQIDSTATFSDTLMVEEEIEMSKADSLVNEINQEERDEFFYGNKRYDHDSDHDINVDIKFKKHRSHGNRFRVGLLDFGFTAFYYDKSFNLPSELDDFTLTYPGSYNINLHFFRHRLNLYNNIFSIDYGISVNWRHFRFQNDFLLNTTDGKIELIKNGVDYKVNKIRTSHLEFPIMLTIRPNKTDFHFSIGGYYGIRMGSRQKLKSDEFGKEVFKDDYNLRTYTHGAVARIGFGPVEFFAQYSPESIFIDEETELDLKPVTFGVAILGF